mmetsp:Transcript_131953/g.228673  ORF Transcript_131953/g.228673 Transcript_131953/m.228673 type:complete len:113 (-) Transcript_131953:128-466(-)
MVLPPNGMLRVSPSLHWVRIAFKGFAYQIRTEDLSQSWHAPLRLCVLRMANQMTIPASGMLPSHCLRSFHTICTQGLSCPMVRLRGLILERRPIILQGTKQWAVIAWPGNIT